MKMLFAIATPFGFALGLWIAGDDDIFEHAFFMSIGAWATLISTSAMEGKS